MRDAAEPQRIHEAADTLVLTRILRAEEPASGQQVGPDPAGTLTNPVGDDQMFSHAHLGEHFGMLKRSPQTLPHSGLWRRRGDVVAIEVDSAGRWAAKPRQHGEQGALASTIGPDQADDRVGRHAQTDAVAGHDAAEADHDILGRKPVSPSRLVRRGHERPPSFVLAMSDDPRFALSSPGATPATADCRRPRRRYISCSRLRACMVTDPSGSMIRPIAPSPNNNVGTLPQAPARYVSKMPGTTLYASRATIAATMERYPIVTRTASQANPV